MILHRGNSFIGGEIELDNASFEECRFEKCALVFSGTAPVNMVACSFQGTSWRFEGAAATTLSFLRGMYTGMGEHGRQMVQLALEDTQGQGVGANKIAIAQTP